MILVNILEMNFFYNTSIGLLKVFTNKVSYSLKESYELNILNDNDLSKINLLYKAYFWEIEDLEYNDNDDVS